MNWKFYKLVESELKNDYSCTLLNTGGFGIHIVHGAFNDGCKAAGWTVQKTLSSKIDSRTSVKQQVAVYSS